jgi:hypothetical protein
VTDVVLCCSAIWMRRSTSRIESRYWSTVWRSLVPSSRCSRAMSSVTESRMLLFFFSSRRLAATLPPSPNIRSNTMRGSASAGSGVDGEDQDRSF